MSIVNYGRRGVCGSRSNISRITSKALCDICRYCCVRAELAFIRSAKDNVCLARISFDRRKSTQITLSRNMTRSSHVGRLYRQRAIAMPRSPERLILLEQPLETRPDVRGCERIAAQQGKTASANRPASRLKLLPAQVAPQLERLRRGDGLLESIHNRPTVICLTVPIVSWTPQSLS